VIAPAPKNPLLAGNMEYKRAAIASAVLSIVTCTIVGAFGFLWIPLLMAIAYLLRQPEDPTEMHAAWLIGQLDSFDEDDDDVNQPVFSQVAQAAAVECRIKFGLMRDTKANRMIVSGWLRSWLSERVDMRKVDQARHYPMALEACFVPTLEDVAAARFRESRTRNARISAARIQQQ